MARTGDQVIREDHEPIVMLRCLVAAMENRLATRRMVVPVAELEAIRGERMVMLQGGPDTVTVVVMSAEEGARELERREHRIVLPSIDLSPPKPYRCGTCGSTSLVLRSPGGGPWDLECSAGHPWALVPGEDVEIRAEAG